MRPSTVDLNVRWECTNSQAVRIGFVHDDRFRFECPSRVRKIRQRESRANVWIGSNQDHGLVLPIGLPIIRKSDGNAAYRFHSRHSLSNFSKTTFQSCREIETIYSSR